jgi:hypothetical protein
MASFRFVNFVHSISRRKVNPMAEREEKQQGRDVEDPPV